MKPYLKLLALAAATMLIINRQSVLFQVIMAAGLSLGLGRRLRPRLKFIGLVPGFIILFQLIGNRAVPPGIRWQLGLLHSLKITNLSLAVLAYTSFTPAREIGQTWAFFGPRVRLLITLTLSLIPAILTEAQNIRLVQSSRGKRRLTPLALIIPLLHRTLQRAHQLTLVLETRSAAGES